MDLWEGGNLGKRSCEKMAKCLLRMHKDVSELVLHHQMAGSCGAKSLPVSARLSLYNSYSAVI